MRAPELPQRICERTPPSIEPERHARVLRVQERALPLDEQHLATAAVALDYKALRGARDEVRHDRVDRDPPARDRDPRLAGGNELGRDPATARLVRQLERD